MLQSQFCFLPDDAIPISNRCALVREQGRIAIYNAAGVFFSIPEQDRQGMRTALGMLSLHRLASVTELARAFGVSRPTVYRNRETYQAGGVEQLSSKRGPRGGYKLKGDRREEAEKLLEEGRSLRAAARAVGVSHVALMNALRQGRLRRREPAAADPQAPELGSCPGARSVEDGQCRGGVAVKREEERMQAQVGAIEEAAPRFEAAQSVAGAGVLLALPALLGEGLLEVTEQVYGRLKGGFFGLGSVLLTLAFMALLRLRNPEQLKQQAPGELGRLLGLDRAPEMKTLRRKLREMGERKLARSLADAFARRWAEAEPEALGYLYVDGHVRPYHGRRHRLPEAFVPRRRLCMGATTDTWVNDARAQPWLFVTAEANDSLLSMLEKEILPAVRAQVGRQRRLTVVFDREGWSPKRFRCWAEEGIEVMTYRKGRYEAWPEEEFVAVQDPRRTRGGSPVVYRLAERDLRIGSGQGVKLREVRRLCDNRHQTSIVTTCRDLPMEEVASRMFARWRQENFFRYMRQEYALDHLITYAVEPADPQRLVPNPQCKAIEKELAPWRRQLIRLQQVYSRVSLGKPGRSGKGSRDSANTPEALRERMEELEARIEQRQTHLKSLPSKVPVGEGQDPAQIVRLAPERKLLTDLVKMVAYRAESAMLPGVGLLKREAEEGRVFLKTLFQTPADLIPLEEEKQLLVRYHSMAQRRFNTALRTLCDAATLGSHRYPGTDLRLVFQGPSVTNETDPCQEV